LEIQPKLLRVLQDQEFERLGSTRTIRVDIRLLAATNRNLTTAVAEGEFRRDLFYRISVFPVRLPALRDRAEDIPQLVHHFVRKFSKRMDKTIETIPNDAMTAFRRWNWPGNVRELENACERIAQTCTCGTVRVGCVSAGILFRAGAQPLEPIAATQAASSTLKAPPPMTAPMEHAAPIALDDRIREFESNLISWALRVSKGNKSKAAELLQVKRSTLGDRIARCGLESAEAAAAQL
jgi:formate hydrogenlyase transcriptional activator